MKCSRSDPLFSCREFSQTWTVLLRITNYQFLRESYPVAHVNWLGESRWPARRESVRGQRLMVGFLNFQVLW